MFYDPLGRVTQDLAWGVDRTYSYDGAGRLASLGHYLAAPANNQTLTFAYNPASQIVQRTRSNAAYEYTEAVSGTKSYTINGLNQYLAAGANSYGYDANGNLSSDGTNTYVYDAENRLVSVSGATSVTLTYDPLGRLWQQATGSTSLRFYYDGDQLVEERDGSGTLLKRYAHAPGEDVPVVEVEGTSLSTDVFRNLMADERGSIVAMTDFAGNLINNTTNTYDEWGVPGVNNQGRFQYTGQVWLPALQLYYYKARMYSSRLGRFLQTDPIGYKDQVNLYEYVDDDPVNKTDPEGENGWDIAHGVLSVASFCPSVCGTIASGLDAGVYLAQGDRTNAAIAGAAAVVGAFSDAGAAKLAAIGIRQAANAARAARAERLAANVARGARGEAATAARLGDRVAGRQVTFRTSNGMKTRADFVTRDGHIIETKTGGGRLTPGQAALHGDIKAGREVTPVGENARRAGLEPGRPTTMNGCSIDRHC